MWIKYLMCDRCKQKMTEEEAYVLFAENTINYLKVRI